MSENHSSIPLAHVSMGFSLKSTPIDYFHLSPSIINIPDEHDHIKNGDELDLNLGADEYLTIDHLNIDHSKKETIVFNLPVGKGKTSVCYDLVRKYHAEGYYVIICSPFVKLVEKDKEELAKYFEPHEIFTYLDIEKTTKEHRFSLNWGVKARILIMTTNMLLQNPGEDFYEQAFTKRDYLKQLREVITSSGKKVVFFFDEIHDAVKNFDREFLPNLIKWIDLTHKCFVSSATFTPASVPVLRHISVLTEMSIKVFYSKRLKATTQANLHLHISTEGYSGKFPYTLKKINSLISAYRGRKINILSGYESIVEAFTKTKAPIPLFKPVRDLNANICTGSTKSVFDENTHNIGTNFTTGVNITSANGVLIIIIPPITRSDASYGVFTDGIPSIVQSVARLRNGGDVHIFMYAPNTVIDIEGHKLNIEEKLYTGKGNVNHLTLNDGYLKFVESYNKKYSKVERELFVLSALKESETLKYQPPTLQEDLVKKSQSVLVNKYESFGKGLSPYILWAAINNQFCNATLTSMELITKDYQSIQLTSSNLFDELLELLPTEKRLILRGLPFRAACENIIEYIQRDIKTITNEDDSTEEITLLNKFYLDGIAINIDKLLRKSFFNQALVSILCYLKVGIKSLTKEQYIHTCIANAIAFNNDEITPIIDGYRQLNTVRNEFLKFVDKVSFLNKAGEKLIHTEAYRVLDDIFTADCILAIRLIKANDLLYVGTYSLLQNIENTTVVDDDIKKRVWTEFRKLFTNIGDDRRSFDKEKKYYLVLQPIQANFLVPNVQLL
ncbi:DEAD/DEAH box helicase [Chitinophaga sp. S165]|uniref:DEAD/DEAH box helicase family protein n=1 Tax=Chitinophaga sp. S165 TaxID=2135462 RepID=UPI000D71BF1B|nr:DEAD/DEAH box helicase [Chitinophaga sp. S165]PWV45346.1 type III restriction/modification enzyme restriction subunit [Chitinophaga sp. S165]